MATPILSKKQQKSSLSAKKSKTKTTVKNVLMTPYKKFWPLVNDTDQNIIEEMLKEHLPRVAREKINLLWKELQKIPKTDRKPFKQDYYNKHTKVEIDHKLREGLHLGINDVTKSLEENNTGAVLIAGDVQPRLLVEHIIDQCILSNVPVLILPSLRDVLKKSCGVKSAAMAVSKHTNNVNLNLILQKLEAISQSYSNSSNDTINSVRVHSIVTISDDSEFGNSKLICLSSNKLDSIVKMDTHESESMEIEQPEDSHKKVSLILEKLHLKREPGSKNRVFVPVYEEAKLIQSSDLFLAFSDSTGKDPKHLESNKFGDKNNKIRKKVGDKHGKKYHSLKVKRTKGDVNRMKKKVDQLKKKK